METLWQDLRYGIRMLVKSPGFALVAVLALALGIGANTAIFSVVNAVLLRPLPYADPDNLVFISEWSQQVPGMSVSIPNFMDWKNDNKVFQNMYGFRGVTFTLTGSEEAERVVGGQVTAGAFDTLGVKPILGRAFTEAEDKPGAERVALLREEYWARRFARDPGVLGQVLTLSGEAYTVIGVMPAHFRTPARNTEIITSLGRLADQPGMNQRGNHPGIYVIARLRPGVTVAEARTEMTGLAQRLEQQYPETNTGNRVTVTPLLERVVGQIRPALMVLLGAVAFVLMIACANVANLLLARAAARQKEIAVRTALGAGRWRLVRQLLTESVLLSVTGGAAGVLLAYLGVRALVAANPANIPRVQEISIDGWVLAFSMVISLLTGLLFGLAPALQVSKVTLNESLKEGGRGSSAGAGRHRLRNLLVVSEISLTLVLLVGTGLMLRSFQRILQADPGLRPEGVLTVQFSLPQAKYRENHQVAGFIRQALENIQALPGVQSVGVITPLPLGGGGWQTSFTIQGRPVPPPGQIPSTDIARVNADYFRTMGVRLLRGRTFTEQDAEGAPLVCIVDELMVKTHFPNEDPIGKSIRLGGGRPAPGTAPDWATIVGVVAHVKNYGVDQDSRVETYVPYRQNPVRAGALLVKTAGNAAGLTSAVRKAVLDVDRAVPVFSVQTMDEVIAATVAPRRLSVVLLSVFALLALALAAVGLYGVMSYSVTERTHEIGIRMALGAEPGQIFRLIVGQGLRMTMIGLVVGLAGAYTLTKLMASLLGGLLFRVRSTDLLTYLAIPVLLALVALVATFVPARRATRVDPMVALRYE